MDTHGTKTITFTEVDELNNPTSTYIYSEPSPGPASSISGKGGQVTGRVDVAVSPGNRSAQARLTMHQHTSSSSAPWSLGSLQSLLIDVFLPAGYPHSVSDDYVPCVNPRPSDRTDTNRGQISNIRKLRTQRAIQMHHAHLDKDSLQAFSSSIAGLLASRAVLQGPQPRIHAKCQAKTIQAWESEMLMLLQRLLSSFTSSKIHLDESQQFSSRTALERCSSRNVRCTASQRTFLTTSR